MIEEDYQAEYFKQSVPEQSVILEEQRQRRRDYIGPIVEKNGRVSVVILSCKRLDYLKKTCETLFNHIDTHEPDVDIEYILVDNGSRPELLEYVKTQRFHKIIDNKKNLGLARGLNQGFTAAVGEFIFQLQDDWTCNTALPLIKMSLEVMHEYEDIGIVRLKQGEQKRKGRNKGEQRQTSSGIKFDSWYPNTTPCGVFCFGCSIFRRQVYLYTGPIYSFIPVPERSITEWAYAREFEKHYLAARIQELPDAFIHEGEEPCPDWGRVKK